MSGLETEIISIVNDAAESGSLAGLVAGLQGASVNTLFTSVGAAVAATLTDPTIAGSADLATAVDVITGVGLFGNEILTKDLLPDVMGGSLSSLATLLVTFQAAGIDTSVLPHIDTTEAVAFYAALLFDPAFTVDGNTNIIDGGPTLNSIINNRNGNFTINGNAARDFISNLGQGTYKLYGNDGDDVIGNVSEKTSILDGGIGNDWLFNLSTKSNRLIGGDGDDTLFNIGSGRNNLSGGDGNDTLINYGTDTNKLSGGKGDDLLIHFGSSATLVGGSGNDTLVGGTADDRLIGGANDDILAGGAGADTFVLNLNVKSTSSGLRVRAGGSDTIVDFDATESDILEIKVRGSAASSVSFATLDFDSTTGVLSFEGTALATLTGVTSLASSDVQFV